MKWSEETVKLVESLLTTSIGGLVVGIAKGIINRYGGLKTWLALLCASVLVSSLTGLALEDSGLTKTQQFAVIGLCTFLAEDILLGLGVLSKMFAKNPVIALQLIWDRFRGK